MIGKSLRVLALLSGISLLFTNMTQAQTRYKDEIFASVKSDTDVSYTRSYSYLGQAQDLKADIFSPKEDTLSKRPLIIFMHGGAFVMGSRKDDYVQQFCRSFAKRGYVTASISYRLGVNGYDPISYGEAIYRAVQDARSALKFFRVNAGEYGIDTSRVYIGGGSAGAITAIHAAYWRQKDVPSYLDVQKLGLLDESTGKTAGLNVGGVVNCWGAIIDTLYIKPGDAPIVSIHGENDPVVPYVSQRLGQFSLYGSYSIQQRAKNLNMYSVLKAFPNTGHGFLPTDTAKWDTTVNTISDFLYRLVKEDKEESKPDTLTQDKDTLVVTGISTEIAGAKSGLRIYPNPAHRMLNIANGRKSQVNMVRLISIQGKEVYKWTTALRGESTLALQLPELPAGLYVLSVGWIDGHEEMRKLSLY